MKSSFILHLDSLKILEELSAEQTGQLFKAIYDYQQTQIEPTEFWLKIAFAPFKAQFERDNLKYETICERNKRNAVKGGRPKKPRNPVGLFGDQSQPKNLDSDNDSDSDSKNINILFTTFWEAFDKRVDKAKCLKVFTKLSKDKKVDLEAVISRASLYREATPESQYRKNPLTWLNGKCWEDEIENKSKPNKYIPTL